MKPVISIVSSCLCLVVVVSGQEIFSEDSFQSAFPGGRLLQSTEDANCITNNSTMRYNCLLDTVIVSEVRPGSQVNVQSNINCPVLANGVFDFRSSWNRCTCLSLVQSNGQSKPCPCTVCPSGFGESPIAIDCDYTSRPGRFSPFVYDNCRTADCGGTCDGTCTLGCNSPTTECRSLCVPPTVPPIDVPTETPVVAPTEQPVRAPTNSPTSEPTPTAPTSMPTVPEATGEPTETPVTESPTLMPVTEEPTLMPVTEEPTLMPITDEPTFIPVAAPVGPPTFETKKPVSPDSSKLAVKLFSDSQERGKLNVRQLRRARGL